MSRAQSGSCRPSTATPRASASNSRTSSASCAARDVATRRSRPALSSSDGGRAFCCPCGDTGVFNGYRRYESSDNTAYKDRYIQHYDHV